MLQHLSGFKGNHGRIWHQHWQGQGQAVVASFSQRSTGGCYPKMLYLLFCLFQCFTLEFVIKIYFTIPGKLLIFTIPGNFLGTNPSQLHLGVPAAPGAANCIGGPCKVARDEWSAADGSCWQWMASGIGVKADQKDHTCHGLGHWLRGGKKCSMGGLASWVADGKPKSYGFFEYICSPVGMPFSHFHAICWMTFFNQRTPEHQPWFWWNFAR